jgi:aerobic-type carbon monoxide dehydrogenase small subunit (CoxS/CutS family)
VRVEELRNPGIERGDAFTFTWNGEPVRAHPGETIIGALLASQKRVVRSGTVLGDPRGVVCGIGICYECRVYVDDLPNVRACVTLARSGMAVRSMDRHDSPEER